MLAAGTSPQLTPPVDGLQYIRARLSAVGANKELFTSDAIAIMHEAASGSLRDIDRVAHKALRATARKKRKLVERDVVQVILQSEPFATGGP